MLGLLLGELKAWEPSFHSPLPVPLHHPRLAAALELLNNEALMGRALNLELSSAYMTHML